MGQIIMKTKTPFDLDDDITTKLDVLEQTIAGSNRPQYFTLGMRADGIPRLTKTTLEEFFKGCVT